MKVEKLYLGKPKSYDYGNEKFETSIFRDEVTSIEIKDKMICGNKQADLKYHGGKYREVYSFDIQDYDYWKEVLGDDFEPGLIGENITTSGLNENTLFLGDRFKFGSAILEVAGPRTPCFKFNIRLGRKDAIKLFLKSKKHGVYYKVIQDGTIKLSDSIVYLGRDESIPSIKFSDVIDLMNNKKVDPDTLKALKSYPDLDPLIKKKLS